MLINTCHLLAMEPAKPFKKRNSLREIICSSANKTCSEIIYFVGCHKNKMMITLIGCGDKRVAQIWDIKERKELWHYPFASAATWSSDGQTILLGFQDGTFGLFDAQTGTPIGDLYSAKDFEPDIILSEISALACSPECDFVAVGDECGNVFLLDIENNNVIKVYKHGGRVNSLTFSSDAKVIISGSWDKSAIFYWIDTKKIKKLTGSNFSVRATVFSPDKKTLAVGFWDGMMVILSYDSEKQTFVPKKGENKEEMFFIGAHLNAMTFMGHKYLACACDDKTIKIFDANTSEIIYVTAGDKGSERTIDFVDGDENEEGSLFAGGDDGTVRRFLFGLPKTPAKKLEAS